MKDVNAIIISLIVAVIVLFIISFLLTRELDRLELRILKSSTDQLRILTLITEITEDLSKSSAENHEFLLKKMEILAQLQTSSLGGKRAETSSTVSGKKQP